MAAVSAGRGTKGRVISICNGDSSFASSVPVITSVGSRSHEELQRVLHSHAKIDFLLSSFPPAAML